MTDSTLPPIKRFVEPFPWQKNHTDRKYEELDPKIYLKTWGQTAGDGFYPIGVDGQWHGGIHFGLATGERLYQGDGVRCIADGEIIAWRYDFEPPVSVYDEGRGRGEYSTSFVLVRHRMQLPSNLMPPAAGDNVPAESPPLPEVTLYSLYMHLLPLKEYKDREKLPAWPFFWESPLRREVGANAKDKYPMWRIRIPMQEGTQGSQYGPSLSGESIPTQAGGQWPEYEYSSSREKIPAQAGTQWPEYGYSLPEERTPAQAETQWFDKEGINLFRRATNELVGWLPRGARITLRPGTDKMRTLASIDEGELIRNPSVNNVKDIALDQLVIDDSQLDKLIELPKAGSVVIPPKPIPVTAGTFIGHLGNFVRYVEVANYGNYRPQLHLELFAASPDIENFINECRRYAQNAIPKSKTLLKIDRGAKLIQPSPADLNFKPGDAFIFSKEDSPQAGKRESQWVKYKRGKLETLPEKDCKGYDPKKQAYKDGKLFFAAVKEKGFDFIPANYFDDINKDKSPYGRHRSGLPLTEAERKSYTHRRVFTAGEESVWLDDYYANTLEARNKNGIIELKSSAVGWSEFPLKLGQNENSEANTVLRILDIEKDLTYENKEARDDKKVRWWLVRHASSNLNKIRGDYSVEGWACESGHEKVELLSPWAWPGFEIVPEDTDTPLELKQKRLQKKYDKGPALLGELFKIIDLNGDGQLSLEEIHSAWRKPWLVQALSRQVVQHKSEWGLPMSYWHELDVCLQNPSAPKSRINFKKVWEEEKKRIEKLRFFDEVKGQHGFPQGIVMDHLHPLAVIENFWKSGCGCKPLTVELLLQIEPSMAASTAETYVPPINAMFEKYGMVNCLYKGIILAQMLHESAALAKIREDGTQAYLERQSYYPYIGRGAIQLTTKENYEHYGNYVHGDKNYYLSSPAWNELEQLPHSIESAGWFMGIFKKANGYQDTDDFLFITAIINGGFNGTNDRLRRLNRIIDKLDLHDHVKLNRDGVYLFEESKIYDWVIYSFAWGLWHDPGTSKHGVTKNADKAIAGYKRFLQIDNASPTKRREWYGVATTPQQKNAQWYSDYARGRVTALGGTL